MKQSLKLLLKITELGVMLALLILFVVLASPILPTKRFFSSYAVVTGSMEPTVPVGALALVQPLSADTIHQQDVIAFTEPGNPQRVILHRVEEVVQLGNMTQFRTKGDNNNATDAWLVGPAQVKGRMLFMIPYVGRAVMFAQTPIGFGVLIGLPAGVLLMSFMGQIKTGIDEEIDRRTNLALAKQSQENQER